MQSFTQSLLVDKSHAASSLGSGFLDVYGTPAMIAFMENTAAKIVEKLDSGYTSVGIEIHVKHLKASKIGEQVTCCATLTGQEKNIFSFEITVVDSSGAIIGTGVHKRAVVEIERFMQKLGK